MKNEATVALSPWIKSLLTSAGVMVIVGPVALGALSAPRLRAQSATGEEKPLAFEVAHAERQHACRPSRSSGHPTPRRSRVRDWWVRQCGPGRRSSRDVQRGDRHVVSGRKQHRGENGPRGRTTL
jgi:hypothetical protein